MLRRSRCLNSCGTLRIPSLSSAPISVSTVNCSPGTLAYARCRCAHTESSHGDHVWPTAPNITPYDVLNQSSSGTYSKGKYFELVKLYHPDLPVAEHPACKNISQEERLRRYHLIVAAHEILSDPSKRRAFDTFGDNWYNRTELFGNDARKFAEKHRKANGPDPSVYRNATWEDWQRYYQRHGRSPTPEEDADTEVPGQSFRSFLLTIVLIMGVTQALTFGVWSTNDAKSKEYSARNAQFLEQRKRNTLVEAVSHDDRIKNFLVSRDPTGSGLKDDEQETYKQTLGTQGNMLSISDVNKMEEIRHHVEETPSLPTPGETRHHAEEIPLLPAPEDTRHP
ncbi:Heat shock protein DnaJ [Ascosphaera apis ARSEF 7405]|uniref:Heat shock protein DnaJ n=1 Tax=Ascosphaera apis ARSEF 7405 TaxID=392613 RepID=A0A168AZI3_9EURO|nr:Heat shock protein DnaJ [Ascosphaera apis ARSEF 7405]